MAGRKDKQSGQLLNHIQKSFDNRSQATFTESIDVGQVLPRHVYGGSELRQRRYVFRGSHAEQQIQMRKQEICSLYRLAYQKEFNRDLSGAQYKQRNSTGLDESARHEKFDSHSAYQEPRDGSFSGVQQRQRSPLLHFSQFQILPQLHSMQGLQQSRLGVHPQGTESVMLRARLSNATNMHRQVSELQQYGLMGASSPSGLNRRDSLSVVQKFESVPPRRGDSLSGERQSRIANSNPRKVALEKKSTRNYAQLLNPVNASRVQACRDEFSSSKLLYSTKGEVQAAESTAELMLQNLSARKSRFLRESSIKKMQMAQTSIKRSESRDVKNRQWLQMQPTIGSRDHDFHLLFDKISKEQKIRHVKVQRQLEANNKQSTLCGNSQRAPQDMTVSENTNNYAEIDQEYRSTLLITSNANRSPTRSNASIIDQANIVKQKGTFFNQKKRKPQGRVSMEEIDFAYLQAIQRVSTANQYQSSILEPLSYLDQTSAELQPYEQDASRGSSHGRVETSLSSEGIVVALQGGIQVESHEESILLNSHDSRLADQNQTTNNPKNQTPTRTDLSHYTVRNDHIHQAEGTLDRSRCMEEQQMWQQPNENNTSPLNLQIKLKGANQVKQSFVASPPATWIQEATPPFHLQPKKLVRMVKQRKQKRRVYEEPSEGLATLSMSLFRQKIARQKPPETKQNDLAELLSSTAVSLHKRAEIVNSETRKALLAQGRRPIELFDDYKVTLAKQRLMQQGYRQDNFKITVNGGRTASINIKAGANNTLEGGPVCTAAPHQRSSSQHSFVDQRGRFKSIAQESITSNHSSNYPMGATQPLISSKLGALEISQQTTNELVESQVPLNDNKQQKPRHLISVTDGSVERSKRQHPKVQRTRITLERKSEQPTVTEPTALSCKNGDLYGVQADENLAA